MPRLAPDDIGRLFRVGTELGLLDEFIEGVYRIHPVLPWFFRAEFEKHFAGHERECKLAFCATMGMASTSLSKQFNSSSPDAAATLLQIEEPNLRHALRTVLDLNEWGMAAALMHGLEDIYVTIQRNVVEWRTLVLGIAPQVTDKDTGRALPGREFPWRFVTEYQMRIADEEIRYKDAERFARLLVDYSRGEADPYLKDEAQVSEEGFEEIHNLSVMLSYLATFLGHQGSGEGIAFSKEGYELSLKNRDYKQAANCAQGLAWALREVESIRNYDEALDWFAKALEVVPEEDSALKGKIILMMGVIFLHQLGAAVERRNREDVAKNAALAIDAYTTALQLLPEYAYEDRAECLGNLGTLYLQAGELEYAEKVFRDSLPLARKAGVVRFEVAALLNIASVLKEQDRLPDAIAYARAAEQRAVALGSEGQQFVISALELLASIRAGQKEAGTG